MREQIIVWRDDFENIPLEERFVEKWGAYETIYTSSCAVLIESRGNFNLGCFIMFEGEVVFRLSSGVKLNTQLIQRWAFLE